MVSVVKFLMIPWKNVAVNVKHKQANFPHHDLKPWFVCIPWFGLRRQSWVALIVACLIRTSCQKMTIENLEGEEKSMYERKGRRKGRNMGLIFVMTVLSFFINQP